MPKYWVKNINSGKVYAGKVERYGDVSIAWYNGERLYNPYTGETVWGWNNYRQSMRASWERRQAKRKV